MLHSYALKMQNIEYLNCILQTFKNQNTLWCMLITQLNIINDWQWVEWYVWSHDICKFREHLWVLNVLFIFANTRNDFLIFIF